MNENYLMINGKRVDLTEEQIKKLGLKVEKEVCFSREYKQTYYYIDNYGTVKAEYDSEASEIDELRHNTANYCTNKELMQQRALHETLSRFLWRFSMQNDGDKIDWNNESQNKFNLYYSYEDKKLIIGFDWDIKHDGIYFYSEEIAQRAIDEIIIPFMKEHPDFIW